MLYTAVLAIRRGVCANKFAHETAGIAPETKTPLFFNQNRGVLRKIFVK
jgi:hypothetical protein